MQRYFKSIRMKDATIYTIKRNSIFSSGSPCFDFLLSRAENDACFMMSKDCSKISDALRPNDFISNYKTTILAQLRSMHRGIWHAIHVKTWDASWILKDDWERMMKYFNKII